MSSARTVIGALKDMGIAIGLSRFPDKPVAIKVLRFLQADYVASARRSQPATSRRSRASSRKCTPRAPR